MNITVNNRWTGKALFSNEADSFVKAVESQKANLRDANLRGADLRGADLRRADLSDADLSGADLSGADLSGANLRDADLRRADLRGADLRRADLRDADLSGFKLGFTPDATLPKRVAAAILNGVEGPQVKMSDWHTCDTVHCMGGWAIHLSGAAGYALESIVGSPVAALLLMPTEAHMFYKTDVEAIAWAKKQLEVA